MRIRALLAVLPAAAALAACTTHNETNTVTFNERTTNQVAIITAIQAGREDVRVNRHYEREFRENGTLCRSYRYDYGNTDERLAVVCESGGNWSVVRRVKVDDGMSHTTPYSQRTGSEMKPVGNTPSNHTTPYSQRTGSQMKPVGTAPSSHTMPYDQRTGSEMKPVGTR